MALRVRGQKITDEELEFGVEFDDGFTLLCVDENDARIMAQMTSGQLRVRTCYVTGWAELGEAEA